MLKPIALAAALSVGIAATASAMTHNSLNEWKAFGEETQTPLTTHSENIDWVNLYRTVSATPLNGWNGFGEETKTPVVAYNQTIDWANLYN